VYVLQNDILGFDVPMDDAESVQVTYSLAYLFDDVAGSLLAEPDLLREHAIELAARPEFQQQVHILLVIKETEELDDVWVI